MDTHLHTERHTHIYRLVLGHLLVISPDFVLPYLPLLTHPVTGHTQRPECKSQLQISLLSPSFSTLLLYRHTFHSLPDQHKGQRTLWPGLKYSCSSRLYLNPPLHAKSTRTCTGTCTCTGHRSLCRLAGQSKVK